MQKFTDKYHWIELAALLPNDKMVRGDFVQDNDGSAVKAWREKYDNRDIFTSIAYYADPDHRSEHIMPIFLINSSSIENTRQLR